MQFELSERAKLYQQRVSEFMDQRIYPAESLYRTQMEESGNPHFHPPILEELKTEARKRGLWNLFHPHESEEWGSPGLSNTDYAALCELMGRSPEFAPEAMNCNAPDTGNMEILELFGTAEQKARWLKPLLAGEISSAFSMTEPDVASSDATNVQLRIQSDGDSYVLSGRKWFTSNAMHPLCELLIVDPGG
jgi:acyl-CoA dehydrogenase